MRIWRAELLMRKYISTDIMEKIQNSLQKLKIKIAYGSVITLMGIPPKNMNQGMKEALPL